MTTAAEHGASVVKVMINGTTKEIHRGSHTIAELKNLLGVDASLALDQDINGTLTPLDDAQRITIKGDEVFFSHPRTGGSS